MPSVYEVVTSRIIEMLEQGVVPWSKPWHAVSGVPRSLSSQRPYRGINLVLTGTQGYESPYWLSYRQALEIGARVRKGERGTPILFFTKKDERATDGDEVREIIIARYYTVFNVAQVDGLGLRRELLYPSPAGAPAYPIAAAEAIIHGYPNGPSITPGFVKAAFDVAADVVMIPRQETFRSSEEYFSTLFHELVHSTGTETRLKRDSLKKFARFGDEEYSREELVAEIGSAMLCAEAGISAPVINNQAAYIGGWLKSLRADARAVVIAAAQAQKAVEWIMGRDGSGILEGKKG